MAKETKKISIKSATIAKIIPGNYPQQSTISILYYLLLFMIIYYKYLKKKDEKRRRKRNFFIIIFVFMEVKKIALAINKINKEVFVTMP